MSNSIGEKFKITSFGSSHGIGVGAIVDGCPANLELNSEDIQKETDGTPIACVVFNKNQHSKDYSMFKNTPRPSHGDFGWMMKYGNYDYRGGGRGSGRVTIGHVIGGAIAKKLLKTQRKQKENPPFINTDEDIKHGRRLV